MKNKVLDNFKINMGWFFLLMVPLLPTSVHAVITGSKHDLSGTFATTTNQICIFCHTPHNANTTVTAAPLWNHEVTAVAPYTLYDTLIFLGSNLSLFSTGDVAPTQPGGVTKLCLSCHDGTVAVDSYGGMSGSVIMPGTPGTQGSPNLGTDLSDDHPVSIDWNHQTIGAGLVSCPGCHGAGFVIDSEIQFFGGKIECATCHDVHNNTPYSSMLLMPVNESEAVGGAPGSALCLRCHEMSGLVPTQ